MLEHACLVSPVNLEGFATFLPTANEVCEDNVFTGVCLSRERASQGGVHGRGCAWPGGACMAGETATTAGGTHPTGMHACGRSVACFTKNIIVVGLLLVNWTTKARCWLHDT